MARKIRGRNEGSIYQRSSGSWRAQISLNGKRISFSAKTKAECQKWKREMQFHLDQGYDHRGEKITLGNILESGWKAIEWPSGRRLITDIKDSQISTLSPTSDTFR